MADANVKMTPAHDALLEAAYALLKEHDGDMGRVKMQTVVSRAGLTSGAFYNVWPGGLPAFQQSLLEFALAVEHVAYLNQILTELESVGPDVVPLSEVARQFGADDSAHLSRDPGFRVQVALWARHGSDPAVAEALQVSYQRLADTYTRVYDKVLQSYGRRWRKPFNGTSFATLLTALAEGLALRNAVDPENVPSGLVSDDATDPRVWELFGLATAVLLTSTTERETDRSESVWDRIAHLDVNESS